MDMVGRYRQRLTLNGIGSSSVWPHIVERANILAQLNLKLASDSYVPSDATSFYLAGIPVLAAFTGSHEDYHRPSDTADKINYRGLAKTTSFDGRRWRASWCAQRVLLIIRCRKNRPIQGRVVALLSILVRCLIMPPRANEACYCRV